MENKSDIEKLMESIRAFTQSPEYAQLQQAVQVYHANMAELAKAIQPYQAPLQQLAVEISKALALIIEELKQQHEVDTEPLEELQAELEETRFYNMSPVDWLKLAAILNDIGDFLMALPIICPSFDESLAIIGARLVAMAKIIKYFYSLETKPNG